ncbi:hypothetical protein [Mesoterricola sediminis]|uniref:Oligoendopeptidase F n=1 Tax=Mesoterricola sediminis TaxID=2927980 RepID=A0AA48GUI2_9BACT|nr:hypothetical protein [Mesoterricola sediminis]BDU78024.1 hypothetical protein METESE_29820 [Mesoterricola sediminis]
MKILGLAAMLAASAALPAVAAPPAEVALQSDPLVAELVAKYGQAQAARAERGLRQVKALWRAEDGSRADLEAFVRAQFAGDAKAQDALFKRLEFALESLEGHMQEIGRDFKWHAELDLGPLQPVDEILSGYDPGAHVRDDAFQNKLAFVVLLNFRMSTLDERLKEGAAWTGRQWAEARLVDRFAERIPASVNLAIAQASGAAERYIAGYNLWMHHLVDAQGHRAFPAGKRLLSHWNLRDEIKSQYAQGAAGLGRQRTIQKVMERIVTQTIPAVVIDNPAVDWDPFTNQVAPAAVKDSDRPAAAQPVSAAPEPDTRYKVWLDDFKAIRQADPYCPAAPTHIARSFEQGRQLPEARVVQMLRDVCGSPLVARTAKVIQARLGRKLEPFDIWFNGFRPGSHLDEAKLDELVRRRFPTAEAYKQEMPKLLLALGFKPEKAAWLASNIEVDPARGSGHAMGTGRRGDHPRLRTRVGKDGMDYKGFNIAVHENGHNVEQSFSMHGAPSPLMAGVPNTSFTEAIAFTFQARDLELLGQPKPSEEDRALAVLNDFWGTYEIAGVALVDIAAWHWMYEHPDAKPAEFREAVLKLSRDVWNQYYAPVFGQRDCVLLGIYSHMVNSFLYLPDYPVGHMIAFQIQRQIEKTGDLGGEVERMTSQGALTPDLWMTRATGSPVGPEALLEATAAALGKVR